LSGHSATVADASLHRPRVRRRNGAEPLIANPIGAIAMSPFAAGEADQSKGEFLIAQIPICDPAVGTGLAGWSSRSSASQPSRWALIARRRPANSLPDLGATRVADALEVDVPALDVGAHEFHPHATADIKAG